MCSHDGGGLLHGLDDAQLAVHRAQRHQHGILADPIAQLAQVDGPVPVHVQHVDLPAPLLERRQAAADGGVLQWRSDDVPTHMATGMGNAHDRRIVALAGPGIEDHFLGLNAQQFGADRRCPSYGFGGFLTHAMSGVGITDETSLHFTKRLQYLRLHGRVGGIVQVNHRQMSPHKV